MNTKLATSKRTWHNFLQDARKTRFDGVMTRGNPLISIDVKLPSGALGIELIKQKAIGAGPKSVTEYVVGLPYPVQGLNFDAQDGFPELVAKNGLRVEDASPDSVIAFLFFTALQSGIAIPSDLKNKWTKAITDWEVTGNASDPFASWPALAAALSHAHFRIAGKPKNVEPSQFEAAWHDVTQFAIEALLAEYHPANVEPKENGPYLQKARTCLQREKQIYLSKLQASEQVQLSLPIKGTDRRILVDAVFTRELEFAGSLKVFLRNDKENAPLGQGFSFMLLERPDLKQSRPKNWVTISLDAGNNTHIEDLHRELELRETRAWLDKKQARPEKNGEPHIKWYCNPDMTLIGSPDWQVPIGAMPAFSDQTPGSYLSTENVKSAVFQLYSPLRDRLVSTDSKFNESASLLDVPTQQMKDTSKNLLQAWWPKHDPLPHFSSQDLLRSGVSSMMLRVMAARISGLKGNEVYSDLPTLEDFDVVSAGNALCVVAEKGVFLLDAGRADTADMVAVAKLVEHQAKAAAELDKLQDEISNLATLNASGSGGRLNLRQALNIQKKCASSHKELAKIHGTLDAPLKSGAGNLLPLKQVLASRWNTSTRIAEYLEEVDWVQHAAKTSEELRTLAAARLGGAVALSFVFADLFKEPGRSLVSHFLPKLLSPFDWSCPLTPVWTDVITLCFLIGIGLITIWALSRLLRNLT